MHLIRRSTTLLVLGLMVSACSAQATHPDPVLASTMRHAQSAPPAVEAALVPVESQAIATAPALPALAASPTPDPTRYLSAFDDLADKAATYASQPGWLHVRSETFYDGGVTGTLPDGQPAPQTSNWDDWYHLNERGLVYEAVSRQLDAVGNVIQYSTYQDKQWWSSMLGTTSTASNYALKFDSGFGIDLQNALDSGLRVELNQVTLDERAMVEFVITEAFEAQMELAGNTATGSQTYAYFDPTTGVLWRLERSLVLPDGSTHVTARVTTLALEPSTSPAADILALLK